MTDKTDPRLDARRRRPVSILGKPEVNVRMIETSGHGGRDHGTE